MSLLASLYVCLPFVRRETIRVLGLLGALDPYRKKTLYQESNEECLVIPDPDTTDTLGECIVTPLAGVW